MKVFGKDYTAVWMEGSKVMVINQPLLPHKFEILALKNHRETANAIKTMIIRGAGTIGATAAFGLAQAALEAPSRTFIGYQELTPAALVSALVDLHNYLNTRGPTDEWDDCRRWLFNYVDRYKAQLKMEDDAPEIAFRTFFIKARGPFSESERRSVAEAAGFKKQIAKQVRDLKARNVWW